jgi:hypothetical protein
MLVLVLLSSSRIVASVVRRRPTGRPATAGEYSGAACCGTLLTEAAWNHPFQPRIGYQARRRAQGLPQAIRDIAA